MQDKLRYISNTIVILMMQLILILSLSSKCYGGFVSNYPCVDNVKKCVSSGKRIVDGYEVSKDCWEFEYVKRCNYPSKDDCKNHNHCYAVGNLDCLLKDTLGNCVNQQKEFSCKRWEVDTQESKKVRVGKEEKEGVEGLICKGIPCIDGNCVDKSFETNGEMSDSIAKLHIAKEMKGAGGDVNFKVFEGTHKNCSKKALEYSNCCGVSMKGWGKNLGAKCSPGEKELMEDRRSNLCVYVGKSKNKTLGIKTMVKHHYCCFGNMLFKVIQVEGRKQLGKSFGSGKNADCSGLSMAELERLNFDEMDFSEFIEDFKVKFFGKYKSPNGGDMSLRVKSSINNINKYDDSKNSKENNKAGFKANNEDWEAEEE